MDEYNNDMHRKMQSQLVKTKWKDICNSDPSVIAVAFDLQQVLSCPKREADVDDDEADIVE